jgi:hypothetical protein
MPGHVVSRAPDQALLAGTGCGPGGQACWPPVRPGRCPVPGCGTAIDTSRLMCRRDWYAVPKPLRDRVWATWQSGRGALGGDHREAVGQAIAASQAAR